MLAFTAPDTSLEITVTINDDEGRPEISFADLTPSISESGGTLTIRANLSFASTEAVSAKYATSITSRTAESTDFVGVPTPTLLNFTIGQTYAEFTITINPDDLNEGNETFTVTLTEATNATFAGSETSISAIVTIIDDDSPTLSFQTTEFAPGEESGNFDVVVELSRTTTNPVTFEATLGGGTATKDTDYTDLTNSTYTISTGTDQTITIPISTDTLNEGNETFELTLSDLTGASFGSEITLSQTITIVDNEMPTVKFSSATATVSEDVTGGMAELEVSLTGATANQVTVSYATSTESGGGAATPTSDFTGTSAGTANIAAGQLTGTIRIPIINDEIDEQDETFKVTISSPQNAVLSSTSTELTITVTITDDDVPEIFITAVGNAKEGIGATADFLLTADIVPRTGLNIHYLPESASFLPDGNSGVKQSTAQPLGFSQRDEGDPILATLRVPIDNDSIKEANGTIKVTLQDEDPAEVSYKIRTTNFMLLSMLKMMMQKFQY